MSAFAVHVYGFSNMVAQFGVFWLHFKPKIIRLVGFRSKSSVELNESWYRNSFLWQILLWYVYITRYIFQVYVYTVYVYRFTNYFCDKINYG